jgi:hypothetical protein
MQRISFAKEKSDVIAKVEGTFNLRERPKDYFQKKFEEKFVLRPKLQSERKKAENEKKQGRRIDQVWSLLRSTTYFRTTCCLQRG